MNFFGSATLISIHLLTDTHTLVLGDSNLKHFLETDIPLGWQVEIIPGGKLQHVFEQLRKLPPMRPQNIVLAIGINHRSDNFQYITTPALDKLQDIARSTGHRLHATCVSINPRLPDSIQDNIIHFNTWLTKIFADRTIKPVPEYNVKTTPKDQIHYTHFTLEKMWANIVKHLKNSPTTPIGPSLNPPSTTTSIHWTYPLLAFSEKLLKWSAAKRRRQTALRKDLWWLNFF